MWVNLTVSLVRESSGEPKYFIGIIEDISERVLAVEALQKSEEKYRTLFEAESDTIFLVDEGTADILDANDAAVAMYGYSREELMQLKAMDLSAEPEKTIKAIVLDGTTHIPLRYHKKKDGTVFPVEITASDYELDGRSINISTIRDITERVQAEEALREGEERYRSLFDSVPIGLNLTTPEGQILDVNPALVSIMGYPDRESLLAVNAIDLYKDSEDRKYWQGKIENEEFVREFEVQMRQQDGQIIWVESNLHAFRDASGQVQYYEGSTEDITERKRAEEALRESEERFKTLVERNPHGIQVIDPTGIITYVNPAYQEMLGYTKEELLGKHIVDLHEPASKRPELREYLSLLVKEKPEPTTYFQQNRRKDGEVIEQAIDRNYSRDGEGNVVGFISVITEITERVRAEERMKASLREKEVLLKEIHHRVKNNMQVINSLLSLQAARIQDERVRDLLKNSQSRIRSMALVHERLYQSPDLAQVDFAGYVQELSRELFYMYNVNPAAIKIHIDVEGVSLGIDQAVPCGLIINELISNSLKQAFPGDRSGELRLQMRKDREETILVVSDNGVSLPQDLDWRNTTFLGLQLVSTLTEQLEGEIELDRSGGTTFKITF